MSFKCLRAGWGDRSTLGLPDSKGCVFLFFKYRIFPGETVADPVYLMQGREESDPRIPFFMWTSQWDEGGDGKCC